MYPINDKRPCDRCLFMVDTFHPDSCLHPARRDPGPLGDTLDKALHWNGDCPVQEMGRPAFHELLRLNLAVDEWEAAGEYLRARIAEHLATRRKVKVEDIKRYVVGYNQALAVVK